MPRPLSPPAYLRHGKYARTKLFGKYIALGLFNSDESYRRLEEVRKQWEAMRGAGEGRCANKAMTVAQLAAAWLEHIDRAGLYRRADGSPTSEVRSWHQSLAPLLRLFGTEKAVDFSPKKLKTVRAAMVSGSWLSPSERDARHPMRRTCCRRNANQRTARIVRLFAWAVSEELLSVAVHQALATVDSLPAGTAIAADHPDRPPVSDQDFKYTLPYLPEKVRSMALVQLATGMRTGEVCALETKAIDQVGLTIEGHPVWVYRPGQHKTRHHGKSRAVPLGPAAQLILRPLLEGAGRYVFPCRNKAGEERPFRVTRYCELVQMACRKAGIPEWSPRMIRKAVATQVEDTRSLDEARALLGHDSPKTTKGFYARADLRKAARGVAKLG